MSEFSGVGTNPLDGHVAGECSTGCVFGTPLNTSNFTVSGNDVVWAWCGNYIGGGGAFKGTLPADDYVVASTPDFTADYIAEYRIQSTAGSTYAQCKVTSGFVLAIAIKGA